MRPTIQPGLNITPFVRWISLAVLVVACSGSRKDVARDKVASTLREVLGKAANPEVALVNDSTHLLVQVATVAFPTVSDSSLTEHARYIAGLALKHYEKTGALDSVTVVYREAFAPGAWWIRHTRSFPADNFKEYSTTR